MVRINANARRISRINWPALMIVLALLCPVTSFSQEQKTPPSGTQQKQPPSAKAEDDSDAVCGLVRPQEVTLKVIVKNRQGAFVPFLTAHDFVVDEDGIGQDLTFFIQDSDEDTGETKYTFGYVPTNTNRDGQYRRVRVKIPGSKKLGLHIEYDIHGYYAQKR